MLFQKILLSEFHNILEHRAVSHVMAIDHIVQVREIRRIVTVQINRAGRCAVALNILIQIGLVALRIMQNGVINYRSRNGQPAYHILIDGPELLKIDGGDILLLRLRFFRCLRGLFHLRSQLLIYLF